ncbi:MAG: hypothetical protein M5U28_56170, partial [Sandaracinaceae bacterium]|nr:hypothetical protein [Sandaracinaceae bacterium]
PALTVTGAGAARAVEVLVARGETALRRGGGRRGRDRHRREPVRLRREHARAHRGRDRRRSCGAGQRHARSGGRGHAGADVGMRAAIAASPVRVDLVQAALVDLYLGGAGPTRQIFVSALRVCRDR